MPTPPQSELERQIAEQRRRMVEQDAAQMKVMAQRWLKVENALKDGIAALVAEAKDAAAANILLSLEDVYKLEHYKRLLSQARSEVIKYSKWASDGIQTRQAEMLSQGVNDAVSTIEATLRDGNVQAHFNKLPVSAVEYTIGYSADGTPLNLLLRKSYTESVARLTQALIDGNAMGRNPRDTAVLMSDAMAGNLQRALVIARTEQVRAYRSANMEAMRTSGIVEGWIWRSALQDRTCAACLAMDGTFHDISEELNDHPNGRCFKQPVIQGLESVAAKSGEDWFYDQPEETQKAILGKGRYEALQNGSFMFGDLAVVKHDPTWGSEVRQASLSDLSN